MKHLKLFTLIICIIASSCTASKLLTSDVKPDEVKDLHLLEPFSYISKITKGNRGQLNDSVSFISKQLIIKVLENFKGQIPLTGQIILSDSTVNSNLEKEIESLCLSAERLNNISNLRITPTVDKILEANGVRFGLITVGTGFTRIKGNYGKEVAKGAVLGILTLGMYYQTPVKANSTIYALIVDSKENNISFFRKSFLQDNEPLDENVLTRQFNDLFTDYFWTTK